jgi:hypothetical protein
VEHGEGVQISCQPGHRVRGPPTFTCSQGHWALPRYSTYTPSLPGPRPGALDHFILGLTYCTVYSSLLKATHGKLKISGYANLDIHLELLDVSKPSGIHNFIPLPPPPPPSTLQGLNSPAVFPHRRKLLISWRYLAGCRSATRITAPSHP